MPFNNLSIFWLLVAGLACWRLTCILHRERIFRWFRKLLGIEEPEDFVFVYPDNFLGRLLECFDCTSVWIAFGVIVLWWAFPYILLPFAISAAAILLDRYIMQ